MEVGTNLRLCSSFCLLDLQLAREVESREHFCGGPYAWLDGGLKTHANIIAAAKFLKTENDVAVDAGEDRNLMVAIVYLLLVLFPFFPALWILSLFSSSCAASS